MGLKLFLINIDAIHILLKNIRLYTCIWFSQLHFFYFYSFFTTLAAERDSPTSTSFYSTSAATPTTSSTITNGRASRSPSKFFLIIFNYFITAEMKFWSSCFIGPRELCGFY